VKTTVRIGCGAGYAGDRIEPAVELAEHGRLDYLVFECLAERTIALAQQAKAADPAAGFDPLLVDRMNAVLPICRRNGVRIVTNMGAASPEAAAAAVRRCAHELGLIGLRVAAVTGDDVLATVKNGVFTVAETGQAIADTAGTVVSANAYIGAEPIVEALARGADVVITGRTADPSLFVGPLMHAFDWRANDWPMLGRGTLAGHLLECAGQVTGGYFADPGKKDVPGLARLGFPLAEVSRDGAAVITKVSGSGGAVTVRTCKEQLLYEVHDPSKYVTPDVVADFSQVCLQQDGSDRVRVSGATGMARPELLKVALGVRDGFIGEGQISYAGEGAEARARLAAGIVIERLNLRDLDIADLRVDVIGIDALHGSDHERARPRPYEVRLRISGRTSTLRHALGIGGEVEALYTNGPAGGGGAVKSAREVLAVLSTFVPRDLVPCRVAIEEA